MRTPVVPDSPDRVRTPEYERKSSVPPVSALHVFDPPMCCSTGVCGPVVDPDLTRFAADLDWLAGQGVSLADAGRRVLPVSTDPALNIDPEAAATPHARVPSS